MVPLECIGGAKKKRKKPGTKGSKPGYKKSTPKKPTLSRGKKRMS